MRDITIAELNEISGGSEWIWLNDAARAAGSAVAGAVDSVQIALNPYSWMQSAFETQYVKL